MSYVPAAVRDNNARLFLATLIILVVPVLFLAHYFVGDLGGRDGVGDFISLAPDIYWAIFRMSLFAKLFSGLVVLLLLIPATKLARTPGRCFASWIVILASYGGAGYLSFQKATLQNNRTEDRVDIRIVRAGEYPSATKLDFDASKGWTLTLGPPISVPKNETATCLSRDLAGGDDLARAVRSLGTSAITKCATDADGSLIFPLERAHVLVPTADVAVTVRGAWL